MCDCFLNNLKYLLFLVLHQNFAAEAIQIHISIRLKFSREEVYQVQSCAHVSSKLFFFHSETVFFF